MKRLVRSALAGVAFIALAGAAGAQTLNFPSWQTEDRVFRPWWQALIAEFEKRNPGVTVEMTAIPFNQYVNQLTVQFAASSPPDIVHLPSRNFAAFADNAWLVSLDERLAGTDIVENWSPLQEGMVWNDAYQGLLLMGFGQVMFYNQELLDKHGLSVPTTVEQLVVAAETITDRDAGIFGFGGTTTDHPNVGVELTNWVFGQGVDFFKDGKYNFTAPEVLDAVENYRRAYKQAPAGNGTAQTNQFFADGKLGFVIGGPFHWPAYRNAEGQWVAHARMGYVPFDVTPGAMSNSLHIAAATEPAKQDLAWEFIKLAAEPEFQESYTALTFSPASRNGALSADAIAKEPVLEIVNNAAQVSIDSYPTVPKVLANYNEYANYLKEAGIRLQVTDDPTAQVLADLQAELERRIPLD